MRLAACLLALASLVPFTAGSGAALSNGPSPLDGRWSQTAKATTQELVAHGMPRAVAFALARLDVETPAVDLEAGHARWFDLPTGKTFAAGTYVVRGNRVGFAFSSVSVKAPPGVTWVRWSLYRDRLEFSALPHRVTLLTVVLHPWVRVH